MKKYLSYFQMRFNTMLQYRASAIAGVCTQFFWGFMQILIYIAFYKSATSNNISLEQLVSYVWLIYIGCGIQKLYHQGCQQLY